MNGLKKFFGKDDIQVFESGKKSAEQAKQKARKPKSSRWKKYLAVGASLAILGFAAPLNSGENDAYASSDNIKSNKIELASNVTVKKGSVPKDNQQKETITDEVKLAQHDYYNVIETYKVKDKIKDYDGILVNDDMVDKIVEANFDSYFDNLVTKHKKDIKDCEKRLEEARKREDAGQIRHQERILKKLMNEEYDKDEYEKRYKNNTEKTLKTETMSMLTHLAYSPTGRDLVENAIKNKWKISLMTDDVKEEVGNIGGCIYLQHNTLLNNIGSKVFGKGEPHTIYIKSIADRHADIESGKSLKEPYDELEEKSFNDGKVIKKTEREKSLMAAQVWDIAHELRHAWQYDNGIGIRFSKENSEGQKANMTISDMSDNTNSYNIKSLFNIHRTTEADAEAIAVTTAWEMHNFMSRQKFNRTAMDFDLRRVFELQKASDLRCIMANDFESIANKNKMTITEDSLVAKAASAAFKAWHKVTMTDAKGNSIFKRDNYDLQLIKSRFEEENEHKDKIDYNWDFDRKFDGYKFAKSFNIRNQEYIADIADKDFYFQGFRKEPFYETDKKANEIISIQNEKFFNDWFAGRAKTGKKKTDESYKKIIYNPEEENTSSSFNKKAQEKYARKQYNNKVAVALKAKKNARI